VTLFSPEKSTLICRRILSDTGSGIDSCGRTGSVGKYGSAASEWIRNRAGSR
jgi:hypothetical protein